MTEKRTGRPLRERPEATTNQNTERPSKAVAHKLQLDAERFKASRQSAAAPRTAKPQPPDPPEAGLERLGQSWAIIKRDACGKRAVARCCYCQMVREISIADGCVARCGCSGTSPGAGRFAEAHRLPDWRPQR